MPTTSDWLLILLLPGLFLLLGLGLWVSLRRAFRSSENASSVPAPPAAPSQARLLWIGLGLALLAATVALAALFLVLWNVSRR
jgi:hypothetical protein